MTQQELSDTVAGVVYRKLYNKPGDMDTLFLAITQKYDPGASWSDALADAEHGGLLNHDEYDPINEVLADAGINHETSVSAAIGNACMLSVGHAMADYNSPDE